MILFSPSYHPVMHLPASARVFDFTKGRLSDAEVEAATFGIGRYNEKRAGSYTTALFNTGSTAGIRDHHLGVDLFAPVGAAVYSFDHGRIAYFGYNAAPGDYGYTIVVEHRDAGGHRFWALYGHLAARSTEGLSVGDHVNSGQVIAWLGDRTENGDWPSHLHFQLSVEDPRCADMPGTSTDEDLPEMLRRHPDPRLVLGAIY